MSRLSPRCHIMYSIRSSDPACVADAGLFINRWQEIEEAARAVELLNSAPCMIRLDDECITGHRIIRWLPPVALCIVSTALQRPKPATSSSQTLLCRPQLAPLVTSGSDEHPDRIASEDSTVMATSTRVSNGTSFGLSRSTYCNSAFLPRPCLIFRVLTLTSRVVSFVEKSTYFLTL